MVEAGDLSAGGEAFERRPLDSAGGVDEELLEVRVLTRTRPSLGDVQRQRRCRRGRSAIRVHVTIIAGC